MSRLFKNNALVIALALIALVTVYLRIVSPLLGNDRPETPILAEDLDEGIDDGMDGYDDTINGAMNELEFASAQYDIGHFRTTDLHWNEQPARDPFTPLVQIDANDVDAVLQKVQAQPEEQRRTVNQRLPVVSAIVSAERYRYAVVDGEILTVGDQVGNYKVEQINRRSVGLKTNGNKQLINVMVTE